MIQALILCEGRFATAEGKSAHGLLRYSKRFEIKGVIDSEFTGKDSGIVLNGIPNGIPFFSSIEEALKKAPAAKYLIIGVATDGGKIPPEYFPTIEKAIRSGLGIINGLHEFLTDKPEFCSLAKKYGIHIIDIRKLARGSHFFTGNIKTVKAVKIAVLGTDSAIGKRTTAIILKEALNKARLRAVFIGTGQTSWMQGERYVSIIDSTLNDYVSGELENTVVRAYQNEKPDIIIIEGQGSILHPAYPGGFEILSSTKPDAIILQHSPKRIHFDGFEKYCIPSVKRFILVIEKLSGKKVIAITLNHEKTGREEIGKIKEALGRKFKIPVIDPIWDSPELLVRAVFAKFPKLKEKSKERLKKENGTG